MTSVVVLLWRHVGQQVNTVDSKYLPNSWTGSLFHPYIAVDTRVWPCRDVSPKPTVVGPSRCDFPVGELSRKGEGPGVAEGTSRGCSRPRWEVDARSTAVDEFFVRHVKLGGFTARSMNSEAPGPPTSNVMHNHGDHVSIVLLPFRRPAAILACTLNVFRSPRYPRRRPRIECKGDVDHT